MNLLTFSVNTQARRVKPPGYRRAYLGLWSTLPRQITIPGTHDSAADHDHCRTTPPFLRGSQVAANTVPRAAVQRPDRDRRGARIINRIHLLKEDPRPPDCEKLSSQERYRVRQGNYPIVYSTQDDVLTGGVVKIDRRRDVYR